LLSTVNEGTHLLWADPSLVRYAGVLGRRLNYKKRRTLTCLFRAGPILPGNYHHETVLPVSG